MMINVIVQNEKEMGLDLHAIDSDGRKCPQEIPMVLFTVWQ